MGKTRKPNHITQKKKNGSNSLIIAVVSGGIFLLAAIIIIINLASSKNNTASGDVIKGGDITIVKSDVTDTAKFIPYKAGNINMEVVAVKASDGTVRTAFNTCQVCYNSGRGYYVQEGDELICQNCGNRFKLDQVELIKGGCNPVPILNSDKTDDGTNIVIKESYLKDNSVLFGKWKTR